MRINASNRKLDRVMIQTGAMRRNYELYGKELVFVDATFGTNAAGFPLTVLSSVNNEG